MAEDAIPLPKKKRNNLRWLNKKKGSKRNKAKAMYLQIPTVTQDDLRNFQQKHFPGVSSPAEYWFNQGAESYEEYEEYEDDGLGWYSDGTKRTLTDEQIAIFRHSEVQRLIMESQFPSTPGGNPRRLEVESKVEPHSPSSDRMDMSESEFEPQVNVTAKGPSPSRQSIQKKKKENLRGLPKSLKTAVEQDRILEKVDKLDYTSEGNGYTNRRKARELDEIKTEVIELDY